MLGEVEVAAVGDPLELGPADREEVLDVAGAATSSARARRRRARAAAGGRGGCRGRVYQRMRSSIQCSYHLPASSGGTKNSISICSNSRVRKMKLPGVISLRKRLADLGDPERRLLARELQDVLEVDEDALRGLGAQVDRRARVLRPGRSWVSNIRLNSRASVRSHVVALAGVLRRACCPHSAVAEVVGAEALLAGAGSRPAGR